MKIAIIGTGNVGATLAHGWAARHHEIVLGTRNPDSQKARDLKEQTGAEALPPPEAAAAAQVVVLATPWDGAETTVKSLGDLGEKPLLDATNPLKPDLSGLLHENGSGGEQVAGWAQGGHVVKIFNTTGAGNMASPVYAGAGVTMLYAGDDAGANVIAAKLAADLGFSPQRLGDLSAAAQLEWLALTWIGLAYGGGLGPDFALTIVKRGD